MAAYKGKDVAKLKSKGGKWKYMSEADMLEVAAPFAPYRCVTFSVRYLPLPSPPIPSQSSSKPVSLQVLRSVQKIVEFSQDFGHADRSFGEYRSLFMWYMWRIEDVNLDALS